MTSHDRADTTGSDLTGLLNVGNAVARYFERVGITRITQLKGRDPVELHEQMSAAHGQALDPCLLDTIMSAVDQAEGRPARPWWHYTPERKRLSARTGSARTEGA
ncbi:helix-hairpin-helix domain-containing protein [Nonomuraea insulae]|uniref:Helix-hairpin-helix domain-containing protein n=1 Tax=Nonomuraea insulae TaxID=1616787 RepID=A0ABW1D9X0_9ACTN